LARWPTASIAQYDRLVSPCVVGYYGAVWADPNLLAITDRRFGVGIGEAGGTPAQQSLMADIFPPHTRGMAMTIFALGSSIGSMIGSIAGGWLSDRYGWRSALIALGVLGLPLVPLLRFTVTEPVRGSSTPSAIGGKRALSTVRSAGRRAYLALARSR